MAVLALALGLLGPSTAAAASTAAAGTGGRTAGRTAPFLGTLGTQSAHAARESAAGIRLGMVELSWARLEPAQGVFDAAYAAGIEQRIRTMRAAGMTITLGLGLHFAPAWAFRFPNSRFVDERGRRSPNIDLVFNRALRIQADRYLAHVAATFGLSTFWAIRITSGGVSEVLYPAGGSYWAFGVNARNGPQLPRSMPRNPFPGWRPGHRGLTAAQTATWATWYVGALDNTVNWQIQRLRALGFAGYAQVVTPGLGVSPAQFTDAVHHRLPDGTLGRGAAWDRFYAGLPDRVGVTAYVSSVGDHSGAGPAQQCRAGDDTVPLTSPATRTWSATRWISRIADGHGLSKAGENPGWSRAGARHYTDRSRTGLVATAVRQATSCGFLGLYWAHDDQFWGRTAVMGLSRFATWARTGRARPADAPTG